MTTRPGPVAVRGPVAPRGPVPLRGDVALRGEVHRLGPIDDIPIGEGRAFGVNGQQVAIFRLRSGAVHAVSAVCPHRGGPLADGQIDGSVVLCPLHLNAFELSTGRSTTGQTPLQTWHVDIDDDGEILLHLH